MFCACAPPRSRASSAARMPYTPVSALALSATRLRMSAGRLAGALDRHVTGETLNHGVVRRLGHIGAVRSEPADGEVDELRVARRESGVVDTDPLAHTGPEVLHDHVGAARQPLRHCLAVGALEVDHDAALVAIELREHRAQLALEGRPHHARRVTAWRLDLDHVGAEVAENHRAHRTGDDRGEVEHGDPGAGPGCVSVQPNIH